LPSLPSSSSPSPSKHSSAAKLSSRETPPPREEEDEDEEEERTRFLTEEPEGKEDIVKAEEAEKDKGAPRFCPRAAVAAVTGV